MAATIKFRIGGEDIQYPFEVEDSNGDVSITKVVSALKMMRQSVDKTLNKYVEEEKHRGVKDRGMIYIYYAAKQRFCFGTSDKSCLRLF